MAGIYADAPSRRMAWDADGTVALKTIGAQPSTWPVGGFSPVPYTTLIPADAVKSNSEKMADTTVFSSAYLSQAMLCMIFPELREIDGAWWQTWHEAYATTSWMETSGDTTNGVDGTWALLNIAGLDVQNPALDAYRTITSAAVSSVRSVRWVAHTVNSTSYFRKNHAYGTISPGETPDRILFLDTLSADAEFSKVLDYGEVPRGQTQQRTIKLKNNSASYTINTLQLTAEDLYLNAGGWYTFSLDDVSYQGTLAVGNMVASATQLIYVRRTIPAAETLGPQTSRIKVSHASVT
jgi:hypothetical protein